MTDEFYACNVCGAQEPGWRKMFKISHNALSMEEMRDIGFQNLVTETELRDLKEKIGKEISTEELELCCACGKPSKPVMFAHWDPVDEIDDMENKEKV